MDTKINFFWAGRPLSDIEVLSLQSFHKLGYKCVLWSYDKIENVPEFVMEKDANNIIPFKEGKIENFSDYFRYKLLYKLGGIYSDLDNIAIQKLPNTKYIFSGDKIVANCHLLKLPKGALILKDIIGEIEETMIFSSTNSFSGYYLARKILEHNLEDYLISYMETNYINNILQLAQEIIEWSNLKDVYIVHLFRSQHRVWLKNNNMYQQQFINLKEFLS